MTHAEMIHADMGRAIPGEPAWSRSLPCLKRQTDQRKHQTGGQQKRNPALFDSIDHGQTLACFADRAQLS